jgi:hypothetical protein
MILERTFLYRVCFLCSFFYLCYLCCLQVRIRGASGWRVWGTGIGFLIFADVLPIDGYDWG